MGLPEILSIIILIVVVVLGLGLFVIIKRMGQSLGTQNNPEIAHLLGQVQRLESEVTRLQTELKNTTQTLRTEFQNEGRQNRSELQTTLQNTTNQLTTGLQSSQQNAFTTQRRELQAMFTAQETQIKQMIQAQSDSLTQLLQSQHKLFEMQDKRLADMQEALIKLMAEKMDGISTTTSQRLAELERQFAAMREQNRLDSENLRRLVEERLKAIQEGNQQKLDEMRATVDEKLQTTLNERISQSFKMVNERLAEVQQGLGEMRTLATNVGDLKKVMSGVKTRGILGEIQLGSIIEEIMSPEQYETNVATIPGSTERVEYAIRLPGEGDGYVYLPIDAKFPADAYQQLLEAYESADPEAVKAAKSVLEQRIKKFAKDIQTKYIALPHTTNFGIMFLPTEGLYAEVVRMGLVEVLQRQFSISVAGPTTLAALLNSLQMGFRTLAIQKRSGEVWKILGAVKTEFGNFQKVLEKAQERIKQTGDEIEKLVGTRSRAMDRKLREVEMLPTEQSALLLSDASEE